MYSLFWIVLLPLDSQLLEVEVALVFYRIDGILLGEEALHQAEEVTVPEEDTEGEEGGISENWLPRGKWMAYAAIQIL